MSDRNVSISPRKEEIREKNDVISIPIQFELEEIIQHFYDSLEDIKKQFAVAELLIKKGNKESAMDVWRSQVVFAEGIMDFYMHEISKYALVRMFTGEWEKSLSYENFMIPMSTVEEGIRHPESTEWLFERLNKRFGLEVYLSGDALGTQLSLIGMKYDEICKAAFPKERGVTYIKGQQRLKELYTRRNQIAHQADRKHADAVKEPIDKKFVEETIKTVTAFVEAVNAAALAKNS